MDLRVDFLPVLIVGCLVLFAVGIMFHVLLVSKEKKLSIRGLFALLFSAVWALPVAAVMVYLLARTVPQFIEQSKPSESKPSIKRAKIEQDVIVSNVAEQEKTILVSEGEEPAETGSNLPDWVGQPEHVSENSVLISLSSKQWATVEEADREILKEARKRVREYFHAHHAFKSHWTISDELLKQHALGAPNVEKITRKTETSTFEVYRVHRQLTLSKTLHDSLYPVWREQIVQSRLWILGGLLGFITLILATSSTYLRLDAATSGLYRFRLKLAAVSLIVAAGLGVAIALPVG